MKMRILNFTMLMMLTITSVVHSSCTLFNRGENMTFDIRLHPSDGDKEIDIENTLAVINKRLGRLSHSGYSLTPSAEPGTFTLNIRTSAPASQIVTLITTPGNLEFREVYRWDEMDGWHNFGWEKKDFAPDSPLMNLSGHASYHLGIETPGIFWLYTDDDFQEFLEAVKYGKEIGIIPDDATAVKYNNDLGYTSIYNSNKAYYEIYLLKGTLGLNSKHIAKATAQQDNGFNLVLLEFDKESAKKWEEMTEANIGRNIAFVLDGEVLSCPQVNGKIDGGKSVISANLDRNTAIAWASVFQSGVIQIPVTCSQVVKE